MFNRLATAKLFFAFERLTQKPRDRERLFRPAACTVALLFGALLILAGCGGGGGGTTPLQGNAGFRATTVASYQALGSGVAYPYTALKFVSPIGSALRSRAISRQTTATGKTAVTRAAALTLVAALNLYTDGGVITGTTASVNFFVDSAGTQPAGSVTMTLPIAGTDYTTYPVTIPISINITAGNIPCKGNLALVFSGKSGANSLKGVVTLSRDNVVCNIDLGLDDQFNVSGAITIQEGGATIQATNVHGNLSQQLQCDVLVLPYNWTGTGTLSLLDGSMSLNLRTGTGVSTATADSAGNVTIANADGSKDTIHDAFLAGLVAGSNDTITAASGGSSTGGSSTGGSSTGGSTGGTTPTYNVPITLGAFSPVQINNSGQILGITSDTSHLPVFLQTASSTIQKLPAVTQPFQPGVFSALGMNNSGQIVGFGGNLGGVLWQNATSQPQSLAGSGPTAYAISDSGVIVGQTSNSFSPVTTAWADPKTPFTMKSLGIYDTPLAISPDGQIVGWTYQSNAINFSYWQNYQSTPTSLESSAFGSNKNAPTTSMSINASGQICGALQAGGAVYWPSPTSHGQFLPGYDTSLSNNDAAYSINVSGVIVGSAFSSSFYPQNLHAVVWKSLKVQDLNSLIPIGTGWILVSANSINDNGVIVGTGQIPVNGKLQTMAFMLTPK